jgi:hypothetical protein
MMNDKSLFDIIGPWVDPNFESGLIERCRNAWNKPINKLTNEELATLIRQNIAIDYILPIAERRLEDGIDDDTEMYEGELEEVVVKVKSI